MSPAYIIIANVKSTIVRTFAQNIRQANLQTIIATVKHLIIPYNTSYSHTVLLVFKVGISFCTVLLLLVNCMHLPFQTTGSQFHW